MNADLLHELAALNRVTAKRVFVDVVVAWSDQLTLADLTRLAKRERQEEVTIGMILAAAAAVEASCDT